jgi:hypothetical protein
MGAVFSLYDPQELEQLTSGAGFRDVELRSKLFSISLLVPRPSSGNTSTALRWRPSSQRSTT